MRTVNRVSNTVAFPILFFTLSMAGAFGVLLHFGIARTIAELNPLLASAGQTSAAPTWSLILFYQARFWYTVFPALLLCALFAGLLCWLIVRSRIRRLTAVGGAKAGTVPTGLEQEKGDVAERRMFLHLFAMMQQEGRLMDFLAEDLDRYEDAQIGSAVRAIHANCNRVVREYLDPKPILTQAEGEPVTVAADFDPGAVKLTGRVVGEPPFGGILRHKGWRVGRLRLPKLSGRQNAEIISPAEVEL